MLVHGVAASIKFAATQFKNLGGDYGYIKLRFKNIKIILSLYDNLIEMSIKFPFRHILKSIATAIQIQNYVPTFNKPTKTFPLLINYRGQVIK